MYNLDNVKEIANGDDEFIITLIKTFLSEVPPDVEGLKEAVDNGNSALAFQFAHKLKPNLQTFGVHLDQEINAIESWSQQRGTHDDAREATLSIAQRVDKITKKLKEDFSID